MKVPMALTTEEREQIREYYQATGREKLYRGMKDRKVVPFAAEVLCSLDIDSENWREIYSQYEARTQRILEMLDAVFGCLNRNGCASPCVTENFGALLTVNGHRGSFCSSDVDISADELEKAVIRKTMAENGFRMVTRKEYHTRINSDEFICPDRYLNDFYINFVWSPVIREKAYTIDQRRVDAWLKAERLRGIVYRDTQIRLLCPEAMLLHCIYHLSVGHYYLGSPGTKLITEVDRILRARVLNWDTVWRDAEKIGIRKRVQTALALSERLLDTPLDACNIKKPQLRSVTKLIDSMLQDTDGIMTVKEPLGLTRRLMIDIASDDKNAVQATACKVLYAARWFIVDRKRIQG